MVSKKFTKALKADNEAFHLLEKLPYPFTEEQAIPVRNKLLNSISLYSKVIELEPLNLQAFINRAEIRWLPLILDDAGCFEDFDFVVKQLPNSASLHENIGLKRLTQKNYPKAIENFTKAISLSGNWMRIGLIFEHIAEAYMKSGKYTEAIESYSNTIDFLENSDFLAIDVYYHRGFCFKKIGWLNGAKMDYEEFIKNKEKDTYMDYENYLGE
jgi:tetratricopeptide (TPR) repeat protein